jgi:hypothetical protein
MLFFLHLHSGGWNQGPLDTAATLWPIVSAPGDYDNGAIGGMISRGNRSTRRRPVPVPLCSPQTPHAARTRTRAAAVGSQRLTAELRHGPFTCLGADRASRQGLDKRWISAEFSHYNYIYGPLEHDKNDKIWSIKLAH